MKDAEVQNKISVLDCPRFWRETTNVANLRTNISEERANYEVKWGFLYNTDCQICKNKNECKKICKHGKLCKLYVIKMDEGVV